MIRVSSLLAFNSYICETDNQNAAAKKKEQKRTLQGEAEKFLIDIAKYMITAVVISSILKDIYPPNWLIYTICILTAIGIFIIGLYLFKRRRNKLWRY